VAAIDAASGVTPVSIGKPEPYLLEEAAWVVGREPAAAVMIGDGLGTDIAAANAVGARSVLMLTGVTTREAVDTAPVASRPTAVAADATELASILDRLSASR
jgi:ribonucleotide monophosphatase NagD (HAD superfamily)